MISGRNFPVPNDASPIVEAFDARRTLSRKRKDLNRQP